MGTTHANDCVRGCIYDMIVCVACVRTCACMHALMRWMGIHLFIKLMSGDIIIFFFVVRGLQDGKRIFQKEKRQEK